MALTTTDPILAALGLPPVEASASVYQDPAQLAWCQAMNDASWQLQQALQWQAQVAAYNAQCQAAAVAAAYSMQAQAAQMTPTTTMEGGSGTPRATQQQTSKDASQATPAKNSPGASDASTEPGSPNSGDSEEERPTPVEVSTDVAAMTQLQDYLPSLAPGLGAPTKLDLNALIFEQAKDPISAHLLQLLKAESPEELNVVPEDGNNMGKELLDMLQQNEAQPTRERTGPIASGAHRRAAAARAGPTAADGDAETPTSRRRRGGRGGRGRGKKSE